MTTRGKGGFAIMFRKAWMIIMALFVVTGLAVSPAAAQTGIVWSGEFYNNVILQGPAVLARQDTSIAFDWGNGSPGIGVNADNFSARWGTDPFFQAGTYRFWALADDKVRVYVDYNNAPVIDTFNSPAVAQIVAADLAISQGVHHVQVDYQEAAGNAYVFVTWANLATNPTGPNFPPLTNSNPFPASGPWTAQYYSNTGLSGSPALIQTESSPTHDWATGSPVASMPVDNFSARWTSVQTLPTGTYQLAVKADDGVRVTIDGIVYVNEFHQATGQTYSVAVNLLSGAHSFMIEFYEAGGVAYLNFSLVPMIAPPSVPPVVTGASATVTGAFKLNVRNAPSAINTTILTKINHNETYPVVGRNGSSTWWQINVNGIVGWVNGSLVTVVNVVGVPVTDGSVPVPPPVTGARATVTGAFKLNVRNAPSAINTTILTKINQNETYPVVGRNNSSTWWQINVNGIVGWVNGSFVTVVNTAGVPVTDGTVVVPTPTLSNCVSAPAPRLIVGRLGRVTPGLPNNLRSLPGSTSTLLGQIPPGGTFYVMSGPQCVAGSYWWQVSYNGVTGWTPEGGSGQYWVEPI
jgi:uncharacterized protein YgiM (DUF1202 family)